MGFAAGLLGRVQTPDGSRDPAVSSQPSHPRQSSHPGLGDISLPTLTRKGESSEEDPVLKETKGSGAQRIRSFTQRLELIWSLLFFLQNLQGWKRHPRRPLRI
jgi:hypothetical protein